MLKTLEKAGWISIFSQYKLTIISLNWLKHCDTKTDNRFSKFPITETENPDNKPDNKSDNIKASATNSKTNLTDNKTDNKSDSKTSDSRYQNQAQADIRNNTNSIEIKQKEIIRREIKEGGNIEAAEQKSENSGEDGKEKENLGVRHLCEALINEYKQAFAKNFGFYPQVSLKQRKLLEEKLLEVTGGENEKAKTVVKRLVATLPKFFCLNDPFAKKMNYNLMAFAYNLQKLLTSESGITPDSYDKPYSFKKSKKELLKEAGIL